MTIGVNTWVWTSPLTTDALRRRAPNVAEMGFDLIEVTLETTDDLDFEEAGTIVREAGLDVSVCAVIGPGRDLIHPDPDVRRAGLSYLERCIDAAHTLGARNVIGPFYSGVGRLWSASKDERRRDLLLLSDELRDLAAHAAERGVELCIEPLNRYETSFINTAKQGVELVDLVDHPACGLMLDTFHMNIEERSPAAAIRLAGSRLRHLHVCENDRGAPGTGHFPWEELAEALKEIGYDGPIVIESFTAEVSSIAQATAVWRPLSESQDALAREGLAYLRQLFEED